MSQRSLGDYFYVLRERRLIVLGAFVLAIAVGAFSTIASKPSYTATAVIAFQPPNVDLSLVGTPASADPDPDKTAALNAQSVLTLPIAQRVRTGLGLSIPAAKLLGQVTSQVDPSSDVIDVAATSGSAQKAAAIANRFALETQTQAAAAESAALSRAEAQLRTQLRHLKSSAQRASDADQLARLESLRALVNPVTIQQQAGVPATPTSPRPLRDLVIAGILGLIVGIIAAFLRDAFDRKLREPAALEKEYGLPLIGYVGRQALGQTNATPDGNGFGDQDCEAFRILRSNVGRLDIDRTPSTVIVTSAIAEEGKSTVALWYAHASAAAGRRTLLVECDLRRPVLAARTDLQTKPGLVDFLVGESQPGEVIQTLTLGDDDHHEAPQSNGTMTRLRKNGGNPGQHSSIPIGTFTCITAGSPSIRPAELLGSATFQSFLAEVSQAYDLVVLDTSPLLPVGDTLELLPQVDAVIVCARIGVLTAEHVGGAKLALEHFSHDSCGLAVTGVQRHGTDYYGYYGAYRSSVGAGADI